MFLRAAIALAVVAGLAAPAAAQHRESPLRSFARGQDYPVVELVTMGVGSLIWERHGHIALCVVYDDPSKDVCFNYGIGDFLHPIDMALGFFRGQNSFWAGRMDPMDMLASYAYADRTIWVQPLPLTATQKQAIIERLEHDILPDNRYYAYDHFWDNCTTRIRDIIDHATDGALSKMIEPSDGKTYRDLAREGFIGMPSMSEVSLLITDIAMGRVTDQVPTYYERMFLPQFLREAVAKRFGITPQPIYIRRECRGNSDPNCLERGVDVPDDGPSGRGWLALFALLFTAPAWATRKWGRFQRTGLAFAVIPQWLLGVVLWGLAIISPLPYVHWNESCLVFLPLDLGLLFLRPAWRRKYARARVVELALCAVLLAIGVLKQPLWSALLWPLVPAAVVAFWPEQDKR
ncbi:MAG TPA: DUF4105 domain-containing protein [Kofleriaceae bacterium]|nr:DUF4105 domain-containing protein [Kofleriaceae bacterium]